MAFCCLVQLIITILLSPTNFTRAYQRRCIEHEKTLLLELKNQLVFNSSLSTRLVKWNVETDDCCRWKGVKCDGAGHVISLELYNEGISGGFNESSSLFRLKYLEELDLSYNFLEESQIPREIHKLTHLTSLDISHCSLKGSFPEIIFQLPTLRILDLSHNPSLNGTIPQFPQSSFTAILLTNTSFSGSLPVSITHLQRLSVLDLSHCKFTGPIPFVLSNLTQLVALDLSANLFSGAIPSTLSNMTQLFSVDLSENFFTGSISSIHFEDLSNFYYLDLSYNSLSGTIPTSIFTLPSLRRLDLLHNQFSGQVSEFPIVNSSHQFSFLLSSNRLESPIPDSFFNLPSLVTLDLSDNLFNDSFRLQKILSFPNLRYLDLSDNNLSLDTTRVIPSSSNNFHVKQSSLHILDLSNNKIAGEVPNWIWEIGNGSLKYLNLSHNMLVDLQKPCNIPASLEVLDLHSNWLWGVLPPPPQRGQYVDYSDNYFDNFVDKSAASAQDDGVVVAATAHAHAAAQPNTDKRPSRVVKKPAYLVDYV